MTRAAGHPEQAGPERAGPAPRRSGAGRAAGPGRGVGATRPAELAVLGWQRDAGNQAVRRLLARAPVAVQRRVPDAAHADPLLDAAASDSAAQVRGLERAVNRVLSQLGATDRQAVLNQAHTAAGGLTAFRAKTLRERVQYLSNALRALQPGEILGDPALIDTGPRPGTADAANLNTIVANAAALINLTVTRTTDLDDVFGAANVGAAVTNYNNALTRMNYLLAHDRIVTDRSGYGAEVSLGGLTSPDQIALAPDCIDNPNDDENIVTLVHEAMHAGNPAITDHGYINSTGFTALPTAIKLTNAAHYEVVPRRIRNMANRFTGVVFVPAGGTTVVGGVAHTAPPMTAMQQACRRASEAYREAWTLGLQVHPALVRVNLRPADWTGVDLAATYGGRGRFADCLPFWSKVEGLTIHQRTHLSATSGRPSEAPVTQADVALSEGLLRLLADAGTVADQHLDSDAHAQAFLNTHFRPSELAAATSVAAKADLLIRAIRRELGEFTGDERRDRRVVTVMEHAMEPGDFSRIFVPRPPGSFA